MILFIKRNIYNYKFWITVLVFAIILPSVTMGIRAETVVDCGSVSDCFSDPDFWDKIICAAAWLVCQLFGA